MNEIRAHTLRDVNAMIAALDEQRREQERAERKRQAHATSARWSGRRR